MKKLIFTLVFLAFAALAYTAFATAKQPTTEPLPLQATQVGYHYRYHYHWHRSYHWHRAAADSLNQYTPAKAHLV